MITIQLDHASLREEYPQLKEEHLREIYSHLYMEDHPFPVERGDIPSKQYAVLGPLGHALEFSQLLVRSVRVEDTVVEFYDWQGPCQWVVIGSYARGSRGQLLTDRMNRPIFRRMAWFGTQYAVQYMLGGEIT